MSQLFIQPSRSQKKDAGWRYKSPSGRPRFFGLQEHHWAAKFVEMHPLTPQQKCIIWNPSSRADSTSSQRAAVASHPVRFISWRSTNQWEKYPATWTASEFIGFSKSYHFITVLGVPRTRSKLIFQASISKNGIIDFIRTHSKNLNANGHMLVLYAYLRMQLFERISKKKGTLNLRGSCLFPLQP